MGKYTLRIKPYWRQCLAISIRHSGNPNIVSMGDVTIVAADADGSPTAAADGVATADADGGAKTGNIPDVVV